MEKYRLEYVLTRPNPHLDRFNSSIHDIVARKRSRTTLCDCNTNEDDYDEYDAGNPDVEDCIARQHALRLTRQTLYRARTTHAEVAALALSVSSAARWEIKHIRARIHTFALESPCLRSKISLAVRVIGSTNDPQIVVRIGGGWQTCLEYFSLLARRLRLRAAAAAAAAQLSPIFPIMALPQEMREQIWLHAIRPDCDRPEPRSSRRACTWSQGFVERLYNFNNLAFVKYDLAPYFSKETLSKETLRRETPSSLFSLMLTSRQVHAETMYMFLTKCMLSVDHYGATALVLSLPPPLRTRLRYLRLVQLDIPEAMLVEDEHLHDVALRADRYAELVREWWYSLEELQMLHGLYELELDLCNPLFGASAERRRLAVLGATLMVKATTDALPAVKNVRVTADWMKSCELDEVRRHTVKPLQLCLYQGLAAAKEHDQCDQVVQNHCPRL
ncbi:MAG: hypothetical protein M1825_005995 [Sarcosagium campestre]|nr:MAG: hypothetical protein M1825_005995 [Sarcosagium campestre]